MFSLQATENTGSGKDTPSSPDIVAELDRWLTLHGRDFGWPVPLLERARAEIVTLRAANIAWRKSFDIALRDARTSRAEERERVLASTPEKLVAMARAITLRTAELYGDLPPEEPDLTLTTELASAALAAIRRIENARESVERTSAREGGLAE